MKISLGFSTCPNDTFIFDAWVNGKLPQNDFSFELIMEDILHLNQRAMEARPDVVKISYNAYGKVADTYQLLRAGSAMGRGCGPLLIAKSEIAIDELVAKGLPIAIPGKNTTANLLLNYFAPGLQNRKEMLFHEIMPAVASGEVAAGLIIHENRFTYPDFGLVCLQDLGAYWESQTGLPIPLGAIAAKRALGPQMIAQLNAQLRESVEFAFANPNESAGFVRAHAQEMSPEVTQAHINLYVNEFSIDFGEQGEAAIRKLLSEGKRMGLYPEGGKTDAIISGQIRPGE